MGTNREIGCSVCSTPNSAGGVYTRWGSRDRCGTTADLLYSGFIACGWYTHNGSGSNFLCMHPQPQWNPDMINNGSQQGALIYGTEYHNQGSSVGNKNHDHDAACTVCQSHWP